jgi:hypothetical protein
MKSVPTNRRCQFGRRARLVHVHSAPAAERPPTSWQVSGVGMKQGQKRPLT